MGVTGNGFTPKPSATAVLKFGEGEFEGAVVEVSLDASIELYLTITQPAPDDETQEQQIRRIAAELQQFGDEVLLSWNYKDRRGVALPSDGEGLRKVPGSFANAVRQAWLDAKVGVATPLVDESPSGSTSEEATTKTETKSLSLAS